MATLVAHRLDADREIEQAAQHAESTLRALGLRAIGEAKRRELLPIARAALRDPDPVCRFWAGWSLALHGDPSSARIAFECGSSHALLRRSALELALRCGELDWARDVVRSLASSRATRREAIQAVGIFGDPIAVPWLLEHLDDPEHARAAGEAISMITGVDLKSVDLTSDPPDDAEPVAADADLPLPNAAAVREWWSHHRSEFGAGQRHLGGRPVSAAAARQVLRDGYQRQRAGAALELAYHEESHVFPVDARADRQQRALSA
ncbi:MAG: hypothetical protein DME01_00805 [Candidatus Rokuibacteriota bacterium]|nr:MAG: hypothetical protein DME01_00805 [Candidatus Rokubacteria bacterium]